MPTLMPKRGGNPSQMLQYGLFLSNTQASSFSSGATLPKRKAGSLMLKLTIFSRHHILLAYLLTKDSLVAGANFALTFSKFVQLINRLSIKLCILSTHVLLWMQSTYAAEIVSG
jgi:hypothetical protein